MSLTLITTVGTGTNTPIRYSLAPHGVSEQAEFISIPLCQWFKPDQILMLLTPEVASKPDSNWNRPGTGLKDLLGNKAKPVLIPNGFSEASIWEIVKIIADQFPPPEKSNIFEPNHQHKHNVVLDITHGFRTLPQIALVASVLLKECRDINMQHILYGAFEARQGGIAEIIDMTSILDVLDWIYGVQVFKDAGDASVFSRLINRNNSNANKEQGAAGPRSLQGLAKSLQSFADDMSMARVRALGNSHAAAQNQLERARNEVVTYCPALSVALDGSDLLEGGYANTLNGQLNLLDLYANRGQVLPCLTLAREWIVSWADRASNECTGKPNSFDQRRGWAEEMINIIDQKIRGNTANHKNTTAEDLARLSAPIWKAMATVWSKLSDPRNDVNHCGYRLQPLESIGLKGKAKDAARLLREFMERSDQPAGIGDCPLD